MAHLLTEKELAFVERFIETREPSASYKAAGYRVDRMKPASVATAASRLLGREKIQKAIAERMLPAIQKSGGFGVAEILRELTDVITADVAELMQLRRTCCRYCHGKNHAYQWKHNAEWARAVAKVLEDNALREGMRKRASKSGPDNVEPPGNEGGYGYNPTVAPHPQCPECFGEGHLSTFFADTRYLSPKARKLFAGVKETKDGLQVLIKDQQAALRDLMRLLGADKSALIIQNPDGSPVEPNKTQIAIVNADPQEAARIYAQFMKGVK